MTLNRCYTNILLLILILYFSFFFVLFNGYNEDSTTFQYIFTYILYIYSFLSFIIFIYGALYNYKEVEEEKTKIKFSDIEIYPTIDVFITRYDESIEVLSKTVKGCMNIEYPNNKIEIYVLDDGNDVSIRDYILEINLKSESESGHVVNYITRDKNIGKKAGNLNNGLQHSNGDYILVLDCDMIPDKDIVKHILPHFYKRNVNIIVSDIEIGYVQTPQYFRNVDQDYDFYDIHNDFFNEIIMRGYNGTDSAPIVGTGYIIRRNAITEIGGYVTGYATEDVVTGMKIIQNGYKGKYISKRLTYGLAPSNLPDAMIQRIRWVKGSIQTLWHKFPLFQKNLSFKQRMVYLHVNSYWVIFLVPIFHIVELCIRVERNINQSFRLGNFAYVFMISYFGFIFMFFFIPKVKFKSKLRCILMYITYTPVYIYAFCSLLFRCRIKRIEGGIVASKDNQIKRFHPLMWFHIVYLALLYLLTFFSIYIGFKSEWNEMIIIEAVWTSFLYTVFYSPVLYSLSGYNKYIIPEIEQSVVEVESISILLDTDTSTSTSTSIDIGTDTFIEPYGGWMQPGNKEWIYSQTHHYSDVKDELKMI